MQEQTAFPPWLTLPQTKSVISLPVETSDMICQRQEIKFVPAEGFPTIGHQLWDSWVRHGRTLYPQSEFAGQQASTVLEPVIKCSYWSSEELCVWKCWSLFAEVTHPSRTSPDARGVLHTSYRPGAKHVADTAQATRLIIGGTSSARKSLLIP